MGETAGLRLRNSEGVIPVCPVNVQKLFEVHMKMIVKLSGQIVIFVTKSFCDGGKGNLILVIGSNIRENVVNKIFLPGCIVEPGLVIKFPACGIEGGF